MARCPYCNHALEDKWIKHQGASLMGKASGEAKARSRDQASAASRVRWDQEKKQKKQQEEDFAKLRTLAGIAQPKRKPRKS